MRLTNRVLDSSSNSYHRVCSPSVQRRKRYYSCNDITNWRLPRSCLGCQDRDNLIKGTRQLCREFEHDLSRNIKTYPKGFWRYTTSKLKNRYNRLKCPRLDCPPACQFLIRIIITTYRFIPWTSWDQIRRSHTGGLLTHKGCHQKNSCWTVSSQVSSLSKIWTTWAKYIWEYH